MCHLSICFLHRIWSNYQVAFGFAGFLLLLFILCVVVAVRRKSNVKHRARQRGKCCYQSSKLAMCKLFIIFDFFGSYMARIVKVHFWNWFEEGANCLRILLHAYMYAKLAHKLAIDFLILVKIAFVWNLSKMCSNWINVFMQEIYRLFNVICVGLIY